jgi:ketosteroid isomerase-like protein
MSASVSYRALIFSAVAIAALAGAVRAQDSVATQLKRLEDEWGVAVMRKDTVPVARVLASTYISAAPDGHLTNRAQFLEALRTDTTQYVSSSQAGYVVHEYGTTAIISAVFIATVRTAHGTAQQRFRWIDTWVRQSDGRWLCVASLGFPLPK